MDPTHHPLLTMGLISSEFSVRCHLFGKSVIQITKLIKKLMRVGEDFGSQPIEAIIYKALSLPTTTMFQYFSSTRMALLSSSLLFLFLLLPISLSAQAYTNISLGTLFTPLGSTAYWPSPSGDFAFGFLPLSTNSSLFLLAVFFNKLPTKTVVWTANGDNPVTNQSNAELTPDGRLSLQDPPGNEVWNATVDAASYASMLDTGNFVLWSAGTGVIWQTFDHPTDTILPGQVLNQNATVFSRLTDDDYSQGRFVLTLQNDGNLVLNLVAYPTDLKYDAYWSTQTPASGNNFLAFNASTGSIYLSYPNGRPNGSTVTVFSGVSGDNYLRATLDPDGVFRQYSYPKSSKLTNGAWMTMNTVATDICNQNFGTGSGACGFNSYCVPNSGGRSMCICPDHYSFIDPARQYKGCKPDFAPQTCEPGGEASFNFTTVTKLDWPLSDAEHFNPMNETECTDNCLQDCFCAVAIHNNGDCWKKKFPLSNGRLRSTVDRIAFIKYSTVNYSSPIGPSTDGKTDWKTWVFVVSGILGGSIALNLVQMGACCFVFRRNRKLLVPNSASITGPALRSFTYKELEEATKGFSEELGKGAFGTVYKGALPSQPPTLIAVKKLEERLLEEAEKDFANEVATIAQTHHKNLVRLLGFCKDGGHRLMVFEYMSKGSLNKFIFGNGDRPDWDRRVQIALGISSGLAYLHEECRTQIIHCDIKPQNILLDDNLEARISDFGLAKLLRLDQTRTSTGIRGTIGYFAPEWFKNVAVTTKVDVYSFGVMLLEIICCRRNFEWGLESQDKATVIDWAKECYRNGRLDLLVEDDEEAKRDGMRLERFVMVGISCIQDEPWLRPSMKKVVQMLEGSIAVSIPANMYSVRS